MVLTAVSEAYISAGRESICAPVHKMRTISRRQGGGQAGSRVRGWPVPGGGACHSQQQPLLPEDLGNNTINIWSLPCVSRSTITQSNEDTPPCQQLCVWRCHAPHPAPLHVALQRQRLPPICPSSGRVCV